MSGITPRQSVIIIIRHRKIRKIIFHSQIHFGLQLEAYFNKAANQRQSKSTYTCYLRSMRRFSIKSTLFRINLLYRVLFCFFSCLSFSLCVCLYKSAFVVEEPIYNKNSRLKLISYFIVARCRLCFSLAKKKYCQRLSYKQKRTIFIVLTGVS